MGLLEEVRADQDPRMGACKVCAFIEGRPVSEQAEWDELMADRSVSHQSLLRAIKRRDVTASTTSPIERHRKGGHRQ